MNDKETRIQAWFRDLYHSESYEEAAQKLRLISGRTDEPDLRNVKKALRDGMVRSYVKRRRPELPTLKATYAEAATAFKLSPTRIKVICKKRDHKTALIVILL